MSLLFTSPRTVVRAARPIAGSAAIVAAVIVLSITVTAGMLPLWTEGGLQSELHRVFAPGTSRVAVESWFQTNYAELAPAKPGSDLEGTIFAGPMGAREAKKFRVTVHFDREERVTGYQLGSAD
jgi:hypothetical protein